MGDQVQGAARQVWIPAQRAMKMTGLTSRELRVIAKSGGIRQIQLPGLHLRYHLDDVRELVDVTVPSKRERELVQAQ